VTNIEWTDETWNPVVGCSRVSAGCDHCYAMGVAHRGMSLQHRGLTKFRPKDAARPGVDWTGEVRTVPEALSKPLHWRKPRKVFVNSMSDLFHAQVPFEFIAAVFGVMLMASHHTYQVLTKRPDRMLEFFSWVGDRSLDYQEWCRRMMIRNQFRISPQPAVSLCVEAATRAGVTAPHLASATRAYDTWPARSVHILVSVEDQATADERIPLLLQTPAALHGVSYEPALGPVDFSPWLRCGGSSPALDASGYELERGSPPRSMLDWIVIGGESGPGARPFDLAWARCTIADCRAAGVPAFVKQLGARPIGERLDGDGRASVNDPLPLTDSKGRDMNEWPEDLRVREWPAWVTRG